MTGNERFKIIRHLPSRINEPDDLSLPYRLEINLSPPSFMQVAFVMLHGGSEEVVARCADARAVEQLLEEYDFRGHPRLRWIKMTGPDGVTADITKRAA